MQRGTRKTIVSTSKKYPLEPRVIALGWPNRYKFFLAPLRIHFYRSKSTLHSLKSVFKVFRRKPSLGAPASSCSSNCTSSSKKKKNRLKVVGSRLVGTKKVYICQRPDISPFFLPSFAWHPVKIFVHWFTISQVYGQIFEISDDYYFAFFYVMLSRVMEIATQLICSSVV